MKKSTLPLPAVLDTQRLGRSELQTQPLEIAGQQMTGERAILVGGKRFKLDDYRANSAACMLALRQARSLGGHANCLCVEPAPRLVIRRLPGALADRHGLAMWPNSSLEHAPGCPFRHPRAADKNDPAHRTAAIQEFGSEFHVTPDFSLARSLIKGDELPLIAVDGFHALVSVPATTSLLGVLAYLMERGELHRHLQPIGATWADVVSRLEAALQRGWLGSQSMAGRTYVVPTFDIRQRVTTNLRLNRFLERFEPGPSEVPRFLLLGEIRDLTRDGMTVRTMLKHFPHPVIMSRELGAFVARRYPVADAVLSTETKASRVVALYLVEMTSEGELSAVDAALIATSDSYIPCDSSHEVRLANLLVQSRRTFEKPMKTDPATGLRSDFILLDTRPPTPMEVWGMDSVEYNKHKALKLETYRRHKMQLWEWDARREQQPPALPPVEPPDRCI